MSASAKTSKGDGSLSSTLLLVWSWVIEKENATVFKKRGEHHQMVAKDIHFSSLDTGEVMFYYRHASCALIYFEGNCR